MLRTRTVPGAALRGGWLAKRDAVTRRQLLERLIREEDTRILEIIEYNSKEWNDYLGLPCVTQ